MNRLLRPEIPRADLPLMALGALVTVFMATAAARLGGTLSLGFLLAAAAFLIVVTVFVVAPHVAIACTIPIFALIPMLKIVAFPWIGPLKDLITLAAICAVAILVVQRAGTGHRQRSDVGVVAGVGLLGALYLMNAGGLQWDIAWLHGFRLVSEPVALLLVGLTLGDPRRTLRWAMASLVATAVFVALVGLLQQVLGQWRLYDYGFEFGVHLRTFNGHLRSFGTLDDPFAYAAFLLLGLAAVVMWVRNGVVAFAAGGLIAAGLAASLVRTALVVSLALLGLWLARRRYTTTSIFLMSVAVVTALGFLVVSNASEERTVRANSSSFLTINQRTEAWKLFLGDPEVWILGHGVGEVGTAAQRAKYTVSQDPKDARDEGRAVDSGYFAVIADVGLLGLAALLAVFGRLLTLGARAARQGVAAGWLALALLTVLLIDAVTRASFTGFPTAFLGLFLVGLALAAAQDAPADAIRRPSRPPAALAREALP